MGRIFNRCHSLVHLKCTYLCKSHICIVTDNMRWLASNCVEMYCFWTQAIEIASETLESERNVDPCVGEGTIFPLIVICMKYTHMCFTLLKRHCCRTRCDIRTNDCVIHMFPCVLCTFKMKAKVTHTHLYLVRKSLFGIDLFLAGDYLNARTSRLMLCGIVSSQHIVV